MAQEKYVGIPDIPADTTSDIVVRPYDLNPDAKYTEPKYLTGEETRKRNLIDGSWKIETGAIQGDMPKVFEGITTFKRAVGDFLTGRTPAKLINELFQSPVETTVGGTAGIVGGTVGARGLSSAAKYMLGKYGTSFLGKGVSSVAGIGGAIAGGALLSGAAGAFMTEEAGTPTITDVYGLGATKESIEAQNKINTAQADFRNKKITQEELDAVIAQNQPIIYAAQQDWRKKQAQTAVSDLQSAQQVLDKAKTDLAEGKITQKEFDNRQKFYDKVVAQNAAYAKDLEGFNKAVELLNGAAYSDDTFTDAVIGNTAEFVQNKDFLDAIKNAQQGIDPEHWANKAAQITGNMVPIIASTVFAGRFGRLGRKQFLQSLINDTDFKTLKFKPVRSRAEATKIAEKAGMTGTFIQELADYTWEDKQKYIEETGDTTLSNYKGGGLAGAAHAAVSAQIEFAGGVEPLFNGALRRVLKSSGGKWGAIKAIAKQGTITGAGESFEELSQGFDRFLNQKISGTSDKTWGEALKEWLSDAAWGFFIGAPFGAATGYYNRAQIVNALEKHGLKPDTAAKVADAMIDQVASLSDPRVESVRENIRQKVALTYEGKGLSGAELEDAIEVSTDLELAAIATDAQERNIDIAEHPLVLNGVVNEIGWFRDGIPEQVADQVAALNDEIAGLRQQLNEENAKEKKDYNKIEDLEAKIEQFYAKLPKEISNLVETDRQKVRQMLAEQSAELQTRQARRKLVRQVQQRAMNALQKAEESDVQQALRRLEQESKTEEKKAKEAERKQRTEQRKLRKAIEKVRQNIAKRKVGLPIAETLFEDADLVYKALKDSGFTDQQIAQMAEEDIVKTVAPYGIAPVAEQFSLADENARLDDIYPAYEGETIEVDGKERTVYNSDGNRIAKSAEALRNFWRWFGDSKVVDEQGRPLVVYHGTDAEFDTFDIEKSNNGVYGKGFYFAFDERIPKRHGNIVMPVYLKIENPFMASGKTTVKEIREKLKSDKYDGFLSSDEVFVKKNTQIKSVNNIGTYSEKTGNIYYQSSVTGRGADVVRGAYFPTLRLVMLTQNADATSLSHELAHDWMQQFFRWYRSGQASESFMQSWGALEKALGISPDDITVPDKASEAFARAYEAWAMSKTDWGKGIDIDDENRDKIVELFKQYQDYLTDIYEDLNNPYFLETWGETGKLKPELQAWFDRVTLQPDLIAAQVASGAITPQQAQAKMMARNVNDVVLAAEENFTEKEKEEIAAVERMNDTSRYEVKGGNKNSLQNRLSGLARDIDDNNIALGRYETHRDMLEVAKAADEFVRTRRDEALAIVNGLQPETEGLYASDLYTALERVARETNDVDLAMELVNSKVAKDLAKEWGQRIAGFRNFTGDGDFDVVSQLKSLDNQFKKDYDEKGKERVKTAVDEYVKELEKADSEQDVDSFLDSVKCQ